MRATRPSLIVAALVLASLVVVAAEPPPPSFVCSGGGPSWRLNLEGTRARLWMPPAPVVALQGRFSANEQTKTYGWRGRASGKADVVAFVNEATCVDGAEEHPFTARLSLPDGRFLAGCCRLSAGGPAVEPAVEAKPTPVPPPTPAPSSGDWISSLVTFFPSINACVAESRRTEAVVFAAARPDKSVHLVLRLPGERYADCHLPPNRGPAKVTLRAQGATRSAEEQAALLTLLPHEPPVGGCFRSQLVLDEQGRRFGWITFKEC